METKMFEIRDRGTMIPVIATKLQSDNVEENFLLQHAGYDPMGHDVLVSRIEGGDCKSNYCAFEWQYGGARTMTIAHEYIQDNFDKLESGAVVDVEFILAETPTKKVSERF
jgi:hypothetical protein